MKSLSRWIAPLVLAFGGIAAAAAAAPLAASAAMETPPLPRPASGRAERLPPFAASFVEPRPVDVWLPDSYDREPGRRYPVVYMHDGQNVFDGAQVLGPWGGWRVESAIARGAARGTIREAIVVAVWNTGAHRYSEYYPAKALPFLPAPERGEFVAATLAGRARGDDYLRFLVEQVKPEVDRRYRTLPGRADTMVMGSSMGGLVSAYAISEYPEVFGRAACLSLHWMGSQLPGADFPLASLAYFQRRLPSPDSHRIYVDAGDQGLDANYAAPLAMMDVVAAGHGYDADHWRSRRFPGQAHNETAWRERLDEPLAFLLGPP
jgi:predicted alpha/beta superfamily hydrolase